MKPSFEFYEGYCYTCTAPRTILHWTTTAQYECMACHSFECRLGVGYEMSVVLE